MRKSRSALAEPLRARSCPRRARRARDPRCPTSGTHIAERTFCSSTDWPVNRWSSPASSESTATLSSTAMRAIDCGISLDALSPRRSREIFGCSCWSSSISRIAQRSVSSTWKAYSAIFSSSASMSADAGEPLRDLEQDRELAAVLVRLAGAPCRCAASSVAAARARATRRSCGIWRTIVAPRLRRAAGARRSRAASGAHRAHRLEPERHLAERDLVAGHDERAARSARRSRTCRCSTPRP